MNPAFRLVVPPYSGRSVRARAGTTIRITDVQGHQVGDLFAFVTEAPAEVLSTAATRAALDRMFPRVGDPFVTQYHRPILTYLADTSPGVHDMLYAPCSEAEYVTVDGDHPTCRANFELTAAGAGLPVAPVPDPVNLFQNTQIDHEGALTVIAPVTRPGDHVEVRAEVDVTIVLTSCSYDLGATNGSHCTELLIELDPAL